MNPRKNDFIIVVSGSNVDVAPVTLAEMELYVEKRARKCVIASGKKSYGDIERTGYQLIGNFKKPVLKALAPAKKPYFEIISFVLQKFQGGMIVVDRDAVSDDIADLLVKSDYPAENDIDVMICRDGLECITPGEMRKANLLRIHANPEFNPLVIEKMGEFYHDKVTAILVAQIFANAQYSEVQEQLQDAEKKYGADQFRNYIDYDELSRQIAFYVYFDVEHNKLINMSKQDVIDCLTMLRTSGGLPMSDEDIQGLAAAITIE